MKILTETTIKITLADIDKYARQTDAANVPVDSHLWPQVEKPEILPEIRPFVHSNIKYSSYSVCSGYFSKVKLAYNIMEATTPGGSRHVVATMEFPFDINAFLVEVSRKLAIEKFETVTFHVMYNTLMGIELTYKKENEDPIC